MEKLVKYKQRLEISVREGKPLVAFGFEPEDCVVERATITYSAIFILIAAIEVINLLLNVGAAVIKTLQLESIMILCKYIPHDGVKHHIIVRAGKKIKLEYSGDGKWSLQEMESYLWSLLPGINRFEMGAFHLGNVAIAMEVAGEWIKLDTNKAINLEREVEDIVNNFTKPNVVT